jgi:hypothetical protein
VVQVGRGLLPVELAGLVALVLQPLHRAQTLWLQTLGKES